MPDTSKLVAAIAARMAALPDRGKVADYIPELAKVAPDHFGIAVIMADGTEHIAGDGDTAFSVQSISKVFALVEALHICGERVWDRVGKEPSGSAFNSIIQLELEQGRPRNPFINAGAIAVTDLIANKASLGGSQAIGEILRLIRHLAVDDSIAVDAPSPDPKAPPAFATPPWPTICGRSAPSTAPSPRRSTHIFTSAPSR